MVDEKRVPEAAELKELEKVFGPVNEKGAGVDAVVAGVPKGLKEAALVAGVDPKRLEGLAAAVVLAKGVVEEKLRLGIEGFMEEVREEVGFAAAARAAC